VSCKFDVGEFNHTHQAESLLVYCVVYRSTHGISAWFTDSSRPSSNPPILTLKPRLIRRGPSHSEQNQIPVRVRHRYGWTSGIDVRSESESRTAQYYPWITASHAHSTATAFVSVELKDNADGNMIYCKPWITARAVFKRRAHRNLSGRFLVRSH